LANFACHGGEGVRIGEVGQREKKIRFSEPEEDQEAGLNK